MESRGHQGLPVEVAGPTDWSFVLKIKKLCVAILCLAVTSPVFASRTHRAHSSACHTRKCRSSWKRHGQQVIAEDRVREIQAALIQAHYLDGEPNGMWDQKTKAAMTRYQSDQGWQTKRLPDARALIKLGLGPSHEGTVVASDKTASLDSSQLPAQ